MNCFNLQSPLIWGVLIITLFYWRLFQQEATMVPVRSRNSASLARTINGSHERQCTLKMWLLPLSSAVDGFTSQFLIKHWTNFNTTYYQNIFAVFWIFLRKFTRVICDVEKGIRFVKSNIDYLLNGWHCSKCPIWPKLISFLFCEWQV